MTILEKCRQIKRVCTKGVYLFGAGANGRWIREALQDQNIPVIAFIDNDPRKQGAMIQGTPCISYPDYQDRHDQSPVFFTIIKQTELYRKLDREMKLLIPFSAYYAWEHKEELLDLKFEDEASYRTMQGLLSYMETSDLNALYEITDPIHYFGVAPFICEPNGTYVDLGAYVGDTIEDYIKSVGGAFRRVYGFEPGKEQMQAIRLRKERLMREWLLDERQIVLEETCVGRKDGTVYLDTSSGISGNHITEQGSNAIQCVTLDTYFQTTDVTMIKTDIEGADYDALIGGERLIRRCKPHLAISVYHRPDDLLRIYRWVDGLDMGYRFKLRHHACWQSETVLYCY